MTSLGICSSLCCSLSASSIASRSLSLSESVDSGPLSPTWRSEPGRGEMVAACLHRDRTSSGKTAGGNSPVVIYGKVTRVVYFNKAAAEREKSAEKCDRWDNLSREINSAHREGCGPAVTLDQTVYGQSQCSEWSLQQMLLVWCDGEQVC